MFLKPFCVIMLVALGAAVHAQEAGRGLEIDFLGSYYDQDGDRSPVTGGIGTEELQSASPVFVIRFTTPSSWALTANLGVDNITSASTDNIDLNEVGSHVSSASRLDSRVFTSLNATKPFGRQSWGATVGFSKEFDYLSINGGLNWSMDFNQKNTTLAARLHHYADEVDLYGIDGVMRGSESRSTTDVSLSLGQVFSRRTAGSVELSLSTQSGFLSSPFQEVILQGGEHVAERLPDSRSRTALALLLNHSFTPRIIQRHYARYYDDDFGVTALTLELETHFRLPGKRENWLYPILRYHDQEGSDYFGLPETFTSADPFFTADRDIGTFTSTKLGLGWRMGLQGDHLRRFDLRATAYDRDDGLTAFTLSFGLGWSF